MYFYVGTKDRFKKCPECGKIDIESKYSMCASCINKTYHDMTDKQDGIRHPFKYNFKDILKLFKYETDKEVC